MMENNLISLSKKKEKIKNDTYAQKISVSHPPKIYLLEKIYLETDRKPCGKNHKGAPGFLHPYPPPRCR